MLIAVRGGGEALDSETLFGKRKTVEQVEEGVVLAPKFDSNGLIPAVTTDFQSGELLMHAYMNAEALTRTIETAEAHYFSRSRQASSSSLDFHSSSTTCHSVPSTNRISMLHAGA